MGLLSIFSAGCASSSSAGLPPEDEPEFKSEPLCADSTSGELQRKAVYGLDDRVPAHRLLCDPFDVPVRATAIALDASQVRSADGAVSLLGEPLSTYGICADEPFADERVVGFCSGVLVSPDTLLTAGHCLAIGPGCAGTRFVFGYNREGGSLPDLSDGDLYACADVVALSGESLDSLLVSEEPEYALIRLDRVVEGVEPVELAGAEPPQPGERAVLIGHGDGTPATADPNGVWLGPTEAQPGLWRIQIDAFSGSSGGGLYDADGKLRGLLVGGELDYDRAQDEACARRTKFLPDMGRSEFATTAAWVVQDACSGDDDEPEACR